MSKPARIFGVLVVLAVGYSLGSCNDDERVETRTEVKIVKVPTVKTRIEYRDKVQPLPEPCKTAVDALPRIMEGDATQTEAAGKILLALQDLATATAFNEVSEVNELIAVARKEGGRIGTVVNERKTARTTFDVYLAKCMDAIEGSS